jgi:hypothetical protein
VLPIRIGRRRTWRRKPVSRQRGGDRAQRGALQREGIDPPYHVAGNWVGLVAGPPIRPSVAVQRPRAGQELAGFDAGPLPAQRALADLLVLDLRGVAPDEADQLALRGVVERRGDELDRDAGMLGLADDDAQVDRVAAQPVDRERDDHVDVAAPDRGAQLGQLGARSQSSVPVWTSR